MQIRTRVRNGRGEGNLVGNGAMVFLTLLSTQLILEENAIDTFQWNGNVPLANVAPLRNFRCKSSALGFVFRRRQDFARKTLILRQDDVIWAGLRLWCLTGLAAALLNCVLSFILIAATATLVSSRWDTLVWLPNCCSPSLRPNTWQNPAWRTKEMWRSCCVHDEFVMARDPMRSPSKRFPRYNCFEGTWSRKMRFSLLSKFYSNTLQMRANMFYNRCGKDFNDRAVIFVYHEAN